MKRLSVLLISSLALAACGRDLPYSAQGNAPTSPTPDTSGDEFDDTEPDTDLPEPDTDLPDDDDVTQDPGPAEEREFTTPVQVGEADSALLLGFSPDGRWLVWLDRGRLVATDTETGRSRTVADRIVTRSSEPASFSPDSRWIAYRDGTLEGQSLAPLVVAPLDGSTPPVQMGESRVDRQDYRWTPDAQHLVFYGTEGLSSWEVATGDITPIADRASLARYQSASHNFSFSLDGRYFAYVSRGALFVWNFEEATSARLSEDARFVADWTWQWTAPRFDKESARISWHAGNDTAYRVYVHDLESGRQWVSPAGTAPRLSPDWRQVVYLTGYSQFRDGGADLWTYDFVSEESAPVGEKVEPFHYEFSSDSAHLIYVSEREQFDSAGGRLHVWSRDSGSTRFLTEVVSTRGRSATDWSTISDLAGGDGSWVAYGFVSDGGSARSELRDLESGRTIEGSGGCGTMYEGIGIEGYGPMERRVGHCALFLPNGDTIQYTQAGDHYHLTRTSLSSGQTEELIPATFRIPRVNASRTLLVVGDKVGERTANVVAVELDGQKLHTLAQRVQLVDLATTDQHVAYTTWSDDGWGIWLSSVR